MRGTAGDGTGESTLAHPIGRYAREVNGRERDSATSDIARGRPTLSFEADRAVADVLRLMTHPEQEEFALALDGRVAQSRAWPEWMNQPNRYLVELDAETVAEIDADVRERLGLLRTRAEERGWELSD